MKNLLIIIFLLTGTFAGRLIAQNPETGSIEKMKVFAGWVGHWQGESSTNMGTGEPRKSTVNEHIQSKLDGMLLLVEGVGKATDPATNKDAVVHHALAVLSFDQSTNQYKFRTYLKDGRSTEAWFNVLDDHKFQWGFDTARGKTRYNIVVDPLKKTWNETGEYSRDGNTWMPFFEMNLKKMD